MTAEDEHRLAQEVAAAPCKRAAWDVLFAGMARHGLRDLEQLPEKLLETLTDLIAEKPE